jgi:hypothetical protein
MTSSSALPVAPSAPAIAPSFLDRLRALAKDGLPRMWSVPQERYVFRLRRTPDGILSEGLSRRYTAITLIGLAEEEPDVAPTMMGGHSAKEVAQRLVDELPSVTNLGDVALTLWAARAVGIEDRRAAWDRLSAMTPDVGARYTVEVAWALAALCLDEDAPARDLRDRLARRLLDAQGGRSSLFPHVIGGKGLRAHVSCFADLVYPVHALSYFSRATGDRKALDAAAACARRFCELMGKAGQWWWHYDWRTGDVVEGYPVYAVHQDAMAPMALHAVEDAGGPSFAAQVDLGMQWLKSAPELRGGTLVDDAAGLIWRKVARREPGKLARSLQALASAAHPKLRFPGVDALLPPGPIDHEDRPYHLGWLFYAWPKKRRGGGAAR